MLVHCFLTGLMVQGRYDFMRFDYLNSFKHMLFTVRLQINYILLFVGNNIDITSLLLCTPDTGMSSMSEKFR